LQALGKELTLVGLKVQNPEARPCATFVQVDNGNVARRSMCRLIYQDAIALPQSKWVSQGNNWTSIKQKSNENTLRIVGNPNYGCLNEAI
jgi:hypothetical protein